MQELKQHGYGVKSFLSILQNDNDTNTLVFTSKEFHPLSETFSDQYAFVGPSFDYTPVSSPKSGQKTVYVSLGTVLNKNNDFYLNCIKAFKGYPVKVIMSVGDKTNISTLGELPENFDVESRMDQIAVLQTVEAFLTHGGMNSASESLYFGVPMVLFPQHSEQAMVAGRAVELGAGLILKKNTAESIRATIDKILNDASYTDNAQKISQSLRAAGGAKRAADFIVRIAEHQG